MATRTHRWTLLAGCLLLPAQAFYAQVFVVGEKTATADISTSFHPTSLPLSDQKLNERGRRELVRNLEAEQGFAHRPLPIGVLTLEANGELSPGGEKYREMIYKKGRPPRPAIVSSLLLSISKAIASSLTSMAGPTPSTAS